jgi:hypothetical protein
MIVLKKTEGGESPCYMNVYIYIYIYRTEVTRKVGLPGAARMRSWPLIAGHVAAVLAFDDVIVREVHLWCTKPKRQNDFVCVR